VRETVGTEGVYMSEYEYREPVSDPEAEGLPDVADDDSQADPERDTAREADGPDPAALPADEPQGIDEFGTTLAESRQGEALDDQLRRERPDVDPDAPLPRGELAGMVDEPPVRPNLDSPVTLYDQDDTDRPAGRLVQPDQGVGPDVEADEIATDVGVAGGGMTAEEAAVREEPEWPEEPAEEP
jgi:Family of unknown function (DUF5709)